MTPSDRDPRPAPTRSLRASLIMLTFGLGVLLFLVAIGEGDWFRLRPASGTAAAMWHAAERDPAPPAR